MARNEVFRDADYLSLPVVAGVKSGEPVRVGNLNGVAQTDRTDLTATPDPVRGPAVNTNPDGCATVWLKGAFDLPVATTTALTVGAPVYIITASRSLTTTDNSAANPLFGHALTPKGTTAGAIVTVRIAN